MGISLGYDSLLSRISTSICDNTTQAHHVELQRLGRRAEVECQLGDTTQRPEGKNGKEDRCPYIAGRCRRQCRALLQGKLDDPESPLKAGTHTSC